ncbi:hypothetical protein NL676_001096 [Syzygium grande]|nr:hypothetical protein NL676_001096 [Syzygium grande]
MVGGFNWANRLTFGDECRLRSRRNDFFLLPSSPSVVVSGIRSALRLPHADERGPSPRPDADAASLRRFLCLVVRAAKLGAAGAAGGDKAHINKWRSGVWKPSFRDNASRGWHSLMLVRTENLKAPRSRYTKMSLQVVEKMENELAFKGDCQDPPLSSSYEAAMEALSSLITHQKRGDRTPVAGKFGKLERMSIYLRILGLEEKIAGLKIIHVAGTKGKGCGAARQETEELSRRALCKPLLGLMESKRSDVARAEELKGLANNSFRCKYLFYARVAVFEGHKYVLAIELFTRAIELDGHNPVYWPNRAYARIKLEEYASPVQDASKAIELDGTHCKGYYMRGVAYLAIRKFREALRDFQQPSKICPRNFDVAKRVKECENGPMQLQGATILPEPKPAPSTNHRGAIILPTPSKVPSKPFRREIGLRKFFNCPADLSPILRRRFPAPSPLTATDFSYNVGSNPAPECSSHCHNARSYESSPCWRYKRPCSAQEEERCFDGAVSSNP